MNIEWVYLIAYRYILFANVRQVNNDDGSIAAHFDGAHAAKWTVFLLGCYFTYRAPCTGCNSPFGQCTLQFVWSSQRNCNANEQPKLQRLKSVWDSHWGLERKQREKIRRRELRESERRLVKWTLITLMGRPVEIGHA